VITVTLSKNTALMNNTKVNLQAYIEFCKVKLCRWLWSYLCKRIL